MSDRYPYQTSYLYCGNNPINIVDPDGMDEWEVNRGGYVKWKKKRSANILYILDNKGKRSGKSLSLKSDNIFRQLSKCSYAIGDENDQDNMAKVFLFMTDNTDVEWRLDRYRQNQADNYSMGTSHMGSESPSAEEMGHSLLSVISVVHSHPNSLNTLQSEIDGMGFWQDRNMIAGDSYKKARYFTHVNYYVYMPNSGRLWEVRQNKMPAFIRTIRGNYKRLFFGTLNTR